MVINRQISRRSFIGGLGAKVVLAGALPGAALASRRGRQDSLSADEPVILSSNESPYGPFPSAIEAMRGALHRAARYADDESERLAQSLANMHGVEQEMILLGAGSTEILKMAALAFLGPDRRLVMADPTFEAIADYAQANRARAVKVPLTKDYKHDLHRMLSVIDKKTRLVYICNPNNPTGTIVGGRPLQDFISKIPSECVVIIDEAYHDFVDDPDYESMIEKAKSAKNVVITRTFSKIYGLAGLRTGYAVGHPDLIRAMERHRVFDSINLMGAIAARASIADGEMVAKRKKMNNDARQKLYDDLRRLGFEYIPSQANFVMIDLRKDIKPVIESMIRREVYVGRLFPAMPNFLRVSMGSAEEMRRFLAALKASI